ALCVGRLLVMRLALPRIPASRAIRLVEEELAEGVTADFSAHPFAPIRVVEEIPFAPGEAPPDLVSRAAACSASTILCDFVTPLGAPLVAELVRCKVAGIRVLDQVALYREMTGRFPIR